MQIEDGSSSATTTNAQSGAFTQGSSSNNYSKGLEEYNTNLSHRQSRSKVKPRIFSYAKKHNIL
jgi:hypothetical protein